MGKSYNMQSSIWAEEDLPGYAHGHVHMCEQGSKPSPHAISAKFRTPPTARGNSINLDVLTSLQIQQSRTMI